jgi:hypothetical protein
MLQSTHARAESTDRTTRYRIEFCRHAEPGQDVLLEFLDPAPAAAVSTAEAVDTIRPPARRVGRAERVPPSAAPPPAEGLEVLVVVGGPQDETRWRKELRDWVGSGETRAVSVKVRDVLAWWGPGRAAILAPADEIQPALLAVVELAFYETELRRLEAETAAAWPEAEQDTPLAYDVTAGDLARQEILGRRTVAVFDRRIRQARIEPHLRHAAADLPLAARRLGDLLRRKARAQERIESLDSKTEVYEYIYELASQRMGEYRNSRRERLLEIIIIVILAVETAAMFIDGFITWWASPD